MDQFWCFWRHCSGSRSPWFGLRLFHVHSLGLWIQDRVNFAWFLHGIASIPLLNGGHFWSETGRIRFRGVRVQTPNSVSFLGLTELRERTQWVPFSLLFVCQNELTEFCAELTEFAPKRTEAQWVLFSETVPSKQYSACFLFGGANMYFSRDKCGRSGQMSCSKRKALHERLGGGLARSIYLDLPRLSGRDACRLTSVHPALVMMSLTQSQSIADVRQEKAHRHKRFGPAALGTTPGLSLGQTQFVPTTWVCPRDKPRFSSLFYTVPGPNPVSPWDKPVANGGRTSSCAKCLCAYSGP